MDDCIPRLITMEVLSEPSIKQHVGVFVVTSLGPSWMDLIIEFLANDMLLNEIKDAEKIQRVAARF